MPKGKRENNHDGICPSDLMQESNGSPEYLARKYDHRQNLNPKVLRVIKEWTKATSGDSKLK